MRVLALDTATDTATVAIVDAGQVLAERASGGSRASAIRVLDDVASALASCQLRLDQLDGIVVGVGPGSFTGIRVGIATAAALADALGVPLAGVSTLAALCAQTLGATAVIDARRGQVFAAGPSVPEAAYAPAVLASLAVSGTILVGDGATRYRSVFAQHGHRVAADDAASHTPRAVFHAALACFDGSPVTPRYLRAPDAVMMTGARA